MNGYIRFILASMVLYSHILSSFRIEQEFNFGVFSVVIFYLLAGHVVSNLLDKKFGGKVISYYIDRFLRIFPTYFLSFLMTFIFLLVSGFGEQSWSFLKVVSNLTVIPLNYYMFIPELVNIVKVDGIDWNLIPPAWSLGAEVQVYLLMPFLIFRRYITIAVIYISGAVFFGAKLCLYNSDWWGYRLLPGVMFIFLSGLLIQRWVDGRLSTLEKYAFLGFCGGFVLLSYWIVFLRGNYGIYTLETILGYLVGVALLFLILKFPTKIPGEKIAGFLSYGLFLNHFTVIWIYNYLELDFGFLGGSLFIYLISVGISGLSLFVDWKIYQFRKKIN